MFGFVAFDYLLNPGAWIYYYGCAGLCINWVYRVYSYMGFAVTKIELHEDGKTVTLTYKTGGTVTLKIKDI